MDNYTKGKESQCVCANTKRSAEAIAVLPIRAGYSGADIFRVSKGTAQGLLGKAYLYQQKWADAAAQLETVITSGQYGSRPPLEQHFPDPENLVWNHCLKLIIPITQLRLGKFPLGLAA